MNYYVKCLKLYATFKGRATRSEYWFFVLINIIISWALDFLDIAIGTYTIYDPYNGMYNDMGISMAQQIGFISTIYSILVILPALAVSVRRLHDTNRSGWWIFINLIPLIGQIWYFVLLCINGTPSENKYGENPKTTIEPNNIVE